MKHVKVFGPGCCRCQDTADLVKAEAEKLGVEVEIEKVADFAEIAKAGIVSTPGVMIEGKLVHAGGMPKAADVRTWLEEA
jgi:small redox-active disulfide protein 2